MFIFATRFQSQVQDLFVTLLLLLVIIGVIKRAFIIVEDRRGNDDYNIINCEERIRRVGVFACLIITCWNNNGAETTDARSSRRSLFIRLRG